MRSVIITALALVVAVLPAQASDCEDPPASPEVTTPATGVSYAQLVLQKEGDEGIYYIDNDLCQPDRLFSVWIYEETNGIPGLQRSDEVIGTTCGAPWPSDTIVL